MCEFPSWIVDKNGKPHWLVDKDIEAAIEDGKFPKGWVDATGHSAIEIVLGVKGEHREGREGLPTGLASDIRSGRCNRMARVEPKHALKYVPDLLPPGLQLFGSQHEGDLDLRGCDLKGITLPTSVGGWLYLRGCDLKGITLPTSVGGWLDLSGCDLKGITLPTSVGGWLDLRGCDLKGITLPTSVGGWLDLSGCKNVKLPVGLSVGDDLYLADSDVEALPHGFKIKGRVIGKDLPIPPEDKPKAKRRAKGKAGKRGAK
ncbi:MAG: hypothetical protein KGN77_05110 [Xanthomonadaceae bacterium]|nr:hypothetical protein [Xanthomonadaceae bacterium]